MEKYSPKPVDATGQTALPTAQPASQPQPAQTDEQIAKQYPLHRPEDAPFVKAASQAPSLVVERSKGEKPPDVTTSDVMNLKVNLDPETLLILVGAASRVGKPLNAFLREDMVPHMQTLELLKEAAPEIVTPQALQSAMVDFIIDAKAHRAMLRNARKEAEKQNGGKWN